VRRIKAGTTSVILDDIIILDTSSSVGAGLTGLAYNTSSLLCYYHRNTSSTIAQVVLASMTLGTFTSGGFVALPSAGNHCPGGYQFCPPDAAFATGAQSVTFYLKGAANMAETRVTVLLTTNDDQVDVAQTGDSYARLGAPAGASVSADVAAVKSDTATILNDVNVGAGAIYARLGAPAGASLAADIAEIEAETDGIAAIPTTPLLAANVPANFAALLISASGHVSNVDVLTGNVPQTGDAFVLLGTPANVTVSADIAAVTDDVVTAQVMTHQDFIHIESDLADIYARLGMAPVLLPLSNFEFPLVDASGAPVLGATVTATRSIDGAAFAACANPVSEVGSGIYKISLAASDVAGAVVTFLFAATGAVNRTITFVASP